MNKTLLILLALGFVGTIAAQQPVKWVYTSKKISDNTYEIHLRAVIDEGWHIYAQQQPEDAIALPTTIKFNKNPLLLFSGKVNEIGTLEKQKVETLGIEQNQFSKNVDFVQSVKLKGEIKTNVSGTLSFMACTDDMCLPPKTIIFTISLD